jgi:UDP-N-acetylglucosamine:LPS N-acetylglucosamine transferase
MHTELAKTFAPYQKIVFVGGGTGGHISPIVSLASELRDRELLWIGGKDSQESEVAEKE